MSASRVARGRAALAKLWPSDGEAWLDDQFSRLRRSRVVTGASSTWRAVTPLGRVVAAVGIVGWVVAARTGWVELATVAAMCVLALVVSLGFLLVGRTQLEVGLALTAKRVVVGDAATSEVSTRNEARHRMLPVRLEAQLGHLVSHVNVPALGVGDRHEELLALPTERRSIVPVGPVRSVQGDPIGLVRRETIWTGTELLYVHPNTVRVDSLTTGWMRDLEGTTTNDRSPSDVAFHTLREYVVGDDRRHIHWRTSARQADGALMVKEFVDTRRTHLGMVLSCRAGDYRRRDEFELAVSIVGSLGMRAIADEQELTCVAGMAILPSFEGPRLLDGLSGVALRTDEEDLLTVAAKARDPLRGASIIVVVSGSGTDEYTTRATADRLSVGARVLLVRAAPGAVTSLRVVPGGLLIDVATLEELPRVIRQVVSA